MEDNPTLSARRESPWLEFLAPEPASLPAATPARRLLDPSPAGPHDWHHRITYPAPGLLTSLKEAVWFWGHHGPWSRWVDRNEPHAPVVANAEPVRRARPNDLRVTWVGHASVILQMGGRTLLFDPVWSTSLVGGIKRLVAPGVAWEALPAIDGVLVSHNHYDHMDKRTLRRLPRDTPIFVPLGNGKWFRRNGFLDVTELDWWQEAGLGGLRIEHVPAHHWSRRGLFDKNHALWGGWVVTDSDGRKAYFAGDTAYGTTFAEIGQRHPGIDLAFLPVGAYAPREHNGGVHMDPEEAVQAFRDLGARAMVPMHWGTFRLSPEPVLEPIEWTRKAWAEADLPASALWELAIGGSRSLTSRPARVPLGARSDPAPAPAPADPAPATETVESVPLLRTP